MCSLCLTFLLVFQVFINHRIAPRVFYRHYLNCYMAQYRQRPLQIVFAQHLGFVPFINRYKMYIIVGCSDQLTGNTYLVSHMSHSDLSLAGGHRWAKYYDIAVIYSWCHAIAVYLQGKAVGEQLENVFALDKFNDLALLVT